MKNNDKQSVLPTLVLLVKRSNFILCQNRKKQRKRKKKKQQQQQQKTIKKSKKKKPVVEVEIPQAGVNSFPSSPLALSITSPVHSNKNPARLSLDDMSLNNEIDGIGNDSPPIFDIKLKNISSVESNQSVIIKDMMGQESNDELHEINLQLNLDQNTTTTNSNSSSDSLSGPSPPMNPTRNSKENHLMVDQTRIILNLSMHNLRDIVDDDIIQTIDALNNSNDNKKLLNDENKKKHNKMNSNNKIKKNNKNGSQKKTKKKKDDNNNDKKSRKSKKKKPPKKNGKHDKNDSKENKKKKKKSNKNRIFYNEKNDINKRKQSDNDSSDNQIIKDINYQVREELTPIPPSPHGQQPMTNGNNNNNIINNVIGIDNLSKIKYKNKQSYSKFSESESILKNLIETIDILKYSIKSNDFVSNLNDVKRILNLCDIILNHFRTSESSLLILTCYIKNNVRKLKMHFDEIIKIVKKIDKFYSNQTYTKRNQFGKIKSHLNGILVEIYYTWEIISLSYTSLNHINISFNSNLKIIKYWINLFPIGSINYQSLSWFNFVNHMKNSNSGKLFHQFTEKKMKKILKRQYGKTLTAKNFHSLIIQHGSIQNVMKMLAKTISEGHNINSSVQKSNGFHISVNSPPPKNQTVSDKDEIVILKKAEDLWEKMMKSQIEPRIKNLMEKHYNLSESVQQVKSRLSNNSSPIQKPNGDNNEESKEYKDHLYVKELKKENFILKNKLNRLNKNTEILFELQMKFDYCQYVGNLIKNRCQNLSNQISNEVEDLRKYHDEITGSSSDDQNQQNLNNDINHKGILKRAELSFDNILSEIRSIKEQSKKLNISSHYVNKLYDSSSWNTNSNYSKKKFNKLMQKHHGRHKRGITSLVRPTKSLAKNSRYHFHASKKSIDFELLKKLKLANTDSNQSAENNYNNLSVPQSPAVLSVQSEDDLISQLSFFDHLNINDDIKEDTINHNKYDSDENKSISRLRLRAQSDSYKFPQGKHHQIKSIIDFENLEIPTFVEYIDDNTNDNNNNNNNTNNIILEEYEIEMRSHLSNILHEMDLDAEGKLDLADFQAGLSMVVVDYDEITEDCDNLFNKLEQDDLQRCKINHLVDNIVFNKKKLQCVINIRNAIIDGLGLTVTHPNNNQQNGNDTNDENQINDIEEFQEYTPIEITEDPNEVKEILQPVYRQVTFK